MKILVVGAGAIGGYFGGRLLQAGRNVTFLVRPRRAEALAKHGLAIRSQFGDFRLPAPPVVTERDLAEPFDLILLSCKAFDLESAIAAFAAAVGPQTMILPLLNGMRHLEPLAERFGADRLLGGFCAISSTLDADGVRRPPERYAVARLRRIGRRALGTHRAGRIDFDGRGFRGSAQRANPAGYVGEMGVHRRGGGHRLSDARLDRRHRRRRRC